MRRVVARVPGLISFAWVSGSWELGNAVWKRDNPMSWDGLVLEDGPRGGCASEGEDVERAVEDTEGPASEGKTGFRWRPAGGGKVLQIIDAVYMQQTGKA